MGFFIRTNPSPDLLPKLAELAGLKYTLAHGEDEHKELDVYLNHDDETITVSGTYTECFTFWEFIGG